jgi:UDP-2-acetamido-2,6-beta-L-arabino-hexul-4-ose reductase
MRIAVTGSDGFLGRHLRARLRALAPGDEVVRIGRGTFCDDGALAEALAGAGAVVHLAGVNRGDPDVVEEGNVGMAERLAAMLDKVGGAPRLLYANSVQEGSDSPYGRGKARASEVLSRWATRTGALYVDVVLPNLYGESGRPDYNSFIATFCHRLAAGQQPHIEVDRELQVLHAQDAAAAFVGRLAPGSPGGVLRPPGIMVTVGEVLARLEAIAATYSTGRFPDLSDPLTIRLFNTYRSYLHPQAFPMPLSAHHGPPGSFVETTQVLGGPSQSSFSTTVPGATRGNHFHLRKVERFVVVRGRARMAIRAVWSDQVATFDVCGDSPVIVDMPTLHTHNITNTGDDLLYTVFWVNEVYDAADPDTFAEAV